jgi:hypothetical protein
VIKVYEYSKFTLDNGDTRMSCDTIMELGALLEQLPQDTEYRVISHSCANFIEHSKRIAVANQELEEARNKVAQTNQPQA